jgi:hypothetical protein
LSVVDFVANKILEFNIMCVKDLASDMLDAMVGQPEIDVVQTRV